jgi:hypothetical protein
MASWDYDPLLIKRRSGLPGDEYKQYYNIPYLIKNSRVILQEVPDILERVQITNYIETTSTNPSAGYFHCDYESGILTFNASDNNKTVIVSFWGVGVVFIPSSRVYIDQTNGEVTQTLEQFVDNIQYMTQSQLNQLNGRVNKNGDSMSGQLTMTGINGITFGNKFKIRYNSSLGTLDIETI